MDIKFDKKRAMGCWIFAVCHLLPIHVVGMAGHGKSALVRALSSNVSAVSGGVETTMHIEKFTDANKNRIWDYPGFGTPTFPITEWLDTFGHVFRDKGVIVLAVGPRIYEQHTTFVRSPAPLQRLVVVRTQVDIFPVSKAEFVHYWKQNTQRNGDDEIYLKDEFIKAAAARLPL